MKTEKIPNQPKRLLLRMELVDQSLEARNWAAWNLREGAVYYMDNVKGSPKYKLVSVEAEQGD